MYRIISTRFIMIDKEKVKEVLNNVVWQMKNGIWENNHKLRGYWYNVMFDKDNNILVLKNEFYEYYSKKYKNPYCNMSDTEIKRFFANKIKTIIRTCKKDEGKGYNPGCVDYLSYNLAVSEEDCKYIALNLLFY